MVAFSSMNKAELQAQAKERGLPTEGTVDELRAALEAHQALAGNTQTQPQPDAGAGTGAGTITITAPPTIVTLEDTASADFTGPGYFIVNGQKVDANGVAIAVKE